MLLEEKTFKLAASSCFRSTLFLFQIDAQRKFGIKISDQIKRIVTPVGGGGSEKGQKVSRAI